MSILSSIVRYDTEIARVIESEQDAASMLLERYRIAGHGKDAFVAALIGRLCVDHARRAIPTAFTGKNP
jgi:hypothetical protein